jgi:hypothetical protein
MSSGGEGWWSMARRGSEWRCRWARIVGVSSSGMLLEGLLATERFAAFLLKFAKASMNERSEMQADYITHLDEATVRAATRVDATMASQRA